MAHENGDGVQYRQDGRQRRTKNLSATATPHDNGLIEKAAEKAGKSKSSFIRDAAVERAISVLRYRNEETVSGMS